MALSIYGGNDKKKAPLSIYSSGASGPAPLSIYGGGGASGTPGAELAALESRLGAPPSEEKGFLRGTAELLGAPQYAVAGAVDEILQGHPERVPVRIGQELISGLPGIEAGAQRKGFGQILEEQGVGTLGSLSDVAPFLYSDTGEGLALQRGGPLDITGRGVVGLGLDVATDPLTYVGAPEALFVRGSAAQGVKLALREALPAMLEEAAKLAPRTAEGAVDLARATARGRELAEKAAESVAFKRASDAAVKPMVADLLKNGIRPNPIIEDPIARAAQKELYHAFSDLVTKEAQDRIIAASQEAPELLWKGGRTFMGAELPPLGLSAALSGVKPVAVSALSKSKAGEWALAQAGKVGDLLNDIKAITIPHWHIRNSPDLLEMGQTYRAGGAFLTQQFLARLEESGWGKLKPAQQELLRQVREGTAPISRLTDTEKMTLEKVGSLLDDMRASEIIHGIVAPGAAPARRAAAERAAADYGAMVADVQARRSDLLKARKALGREFADAANTTASEARGVGRALTSGGREAQYFEGGRPAISKAVSDVKLAPLVADYRSRLSEIDAQLSDLTKEEVLTRNIALQQATTNIHQQAMIGAATTGRGNYFPLIIDNPPEQTAQILRNVPGYRGGPQNIESLGRFNEVRHFDSAEALKEWNRKERLLEPALPEVKVLDANRSLLSRINAHGSAMAGKGYAEELVARGFAREVPKDALDLTPHPLSGPLTAKQTAEYLSIRDAVAKGGTDPRFVSGLSDEGRREFLRQRLSAATSDREVSNIFSKYHEFLNYMPQIGAQARDTFDGSVLVNFDAIPTLRGKMIPFGLAQEMQAAKPKVFQNPAVARMFERWDAINNAMRTGVYSIFPSSQFRNKYSNIATGALAIGMNYLDPRLQKEMLLLRYPKLRGILKDPGGVRTATGEFLTWDEITHAFDQAGITVQGRAAVEQTGAALTKGPRLAHKLAGTLENQDRAALGLYYLKEGRSLEETSRLVNQWMIDYSDITRFDRDVLRRVFLFPTYARKMIPNLARSISENPGRMSNMIRLFNGRDAENQDMTTWEGDAFKLRLDRDGRNLTVLTGLDLPVRQLDTLWRGSATKTALGALGMLTPALKFLPEFGTKVSFFTGRPMTRQESATIGRFMENFTPKSWRDWMGYQKIPDAAGRPHYTFDGQKFYALFQSYAMSRLVSTTDRQFRDYLNDDNWVGTFLDLATGTRLKTINLDDEQRKKMYERLRMARDKAESRGLIKERGYYAPVRGAQ